MAGRFDLEVPAGWTITRNYRFLGGDTLVLERADAAITLSLHADRGRAQALPLDLVASVRALSWGRRVGVENAVYAEHDILLDGRRATAITGLRRWRTQEMGYSMVISRAPGQMLELVLHAPPASLDTAVVGWDGVLSTLRWNVPPEPATPLFVDEFWR